MSAFQLKLQLFCSFKVLSIVLILGLLSYFVVDDFLRAVVSTIQFEEPWKAIEAPIQALFLERGNKAAWLWALLPAQITWLMINRAVKKADALR